MWDKNFIYSFLVTATWEDFKIQRQIGLILYQKKRGDAFWFGHGSLDFGDRAACLWLVVLPLIRCVNEDI